MGDCMKVLNKVKELRWEAGLSTLELAKLSGVSKSNITKIENFMVIPSQFTMIKIAKGFNLRVDEIFNLEYEAISELC
jgi:putative transcriptional regulator